MILSRLMLLVSGLSLMSCGQFSKDDSNKSPDLVNAGGRGCVQGLLLDGLTGKRLKLSPSPEAGKNGINIIVHNKLIPAAALADNSSKETPEALTGEFYACGIPLNETFPLVAWHKGYESFEGIVSIDSTVAQKTPNSEQADLVREFPTLLVDIKLFPVGSETQDLTFKISDGTGPIDDARIILKSTGGNIVSDSRTLVPQIRTAPKIQVTDGLGKAVFNGESLVLGGEYEYTILPPDGGAKFQMNRGKVIVGLRSNGMALDKQAYEINVVLQKSALPAPINP